MFVKEEKQTKNAWDWRLVEKIQFITLGQYDENEEKLSEVHLPGSQKNIFQHVNVSNAKGTPVIKSECWPVGAVFVEFEYSF